MPALSYSNSPFVTLTKISSSIMNQYFTDITTFINTTKLDNTNIQAGGIIGSNLAANTVTTSFIGTGSAANGSALLSSGAATPVWNIITGSNTLYNVGLSITATGGALTVALKQSSGSDATSTSPIGIGLRNGTAATGTATYRAVTAALSQVLSSTTTLGMIASQNNYLWVYVVDSDGAGTMKLGVSTVRYDDGSVVSTVAESFTGTVTIASPGVWTANGHGLNNTDAITLTTTGALPTGLTTGTTYYVVSSAANTFQLAATPGGSAINTSVSQSGIHTIHVANYRMVSAATYTNVASRLIGRVVVNLSVPGTWLTPTEVTLSNGNLPKEDIMARYSTTAAQGIPTSSDTIVNYGTISYDTHGLVTVGASWKFITPLTGKYQITAADEWSAAAWVQTGTAYLRLYKNGSADNYMPLTYIPTSGTYSLCVSGSTDISLSQGDYIDVRAAKSAGATFSFSSTAASNWVVIKKI